MAKKIIVFITVAMLLMSGCSRWKVSEPSPSPSPAETPEPVVKITPEPADLTMTATYGGRADSNFIEVILEDGSFETLKLSDKLRENLEGMGIEEDAEIEITYIEDGGEKTVTEIKEK